MAKFSISMTDRMALTVQRRVEQGDYNNVSEYFRDLVRRDEEKQAAEDRLRDMLDKAEASGVSDVSFDNIWNDAEERYLKRQAAKHG
ncbi:type II toxin-antitoxin system ParD family antitoxin [Asticcacaulis excentricus]|uniref:Addiction module antidote protein, CC2985 family n=1 Tax=Asticcacaulis excentricus (strain ATCC 15261 / DSM 4724 / KCTC 12464 / NCIMB 9791 / VKM B-1370 / CB 48) TaxID=573065 RepID=E8RRK3_ASTEC|nr:type II toxin-antitoxin system ParD family antitoxin [Asticcacaulis excentricus]ADU13448.1 addiction module antidote protein, CC2985 family [Asticcacaulis excentricus CB 48]